MGITFKAVLRVKLKQDVVGIINIRKTVNTKSTFYSLKIKCPVRFWNKKAGTVRKNTELNYEEINKTIADALKEYEVYSQEPEFKSVLSKHSFIAYFQNFIKRYENQGSRKKYTVILNKLKSFLKETGKKDLLYHEIDLNLLYTFRDFSRKTASVNTTSDNLKLIRQVLDSAIQNNEHFYLKHPYHGYDYKRTKVISSALTVEEIEKILRIDLPEHKRIHHIRNCFITQIFLQGMRISDLQLLRWSNIKGDVIDYHMFKTGKYMSVYINDIAWSNIIHHFKKLCEKEKIELSGIKALENGINELKEKRKQYLIKEFGYYETNNFDLIPLDETDEKEYAEEIIREEKRLFLSYKQCVNLISKESRYKDMFIFDLLKNEDFSDINNNDFSRLTPEQYKAMQDATFSYNYFLRRLQGVTGIDKKLKSHLSRSTYASMLLNLGEDVYNISAALGHTSLKTTEHYLSGFNTNKTAQINIKLGNMFNK